MIDAIPLLDRMIERKEEAFERYTGRTRLAIRTEIKTLQLCRKEILRLEEEANFWYKKAEKEEDEKEDAIRRADKWEAEYDLVSELINQKIAKELEGKQ